MKKINTLVIVALGLVSSTDSIQASSEKAPTQSFADLVTRSEAFEKKISFPTKENKIAVIAASDELKQAQIVEHAQNTYPLIHEKTLHLIDDFLAYKKSHGSSVEKALYERMDRTSFINRLLTKRPLVFMMENDYHLLRDGKTKGTEGFEAIGTEHEKAPLLLNDYLSYDEMQISALIGVSVPTYFINDGNRDNEGKQAAPGSYEAQGIFAALVGARFEKIGLMEWQHMIITPEQNTPQNGYGLKGDSNKKSLSLWSKLYGHNFPTFLEVKEAKEAKTDVSGRYIPFEFGKKYFDSEIYKERMRLVIEPFLLDAHNRGIKQGKKVYVHAVGLGLGVWQKIPAQATLMLEVYAQIIKNHHLSQITDIDFSWFPANASVGGVKNGEVFKVNDNAIMIHFSKRNPADKLQGKDEGKLLIAQYAWDGNSYPGNEYWDGNLNGSGDPAAACCSTIAELQNPEINLHMLIKE